MPESYQESKVIQDLETGKLYVSRYKDSPAKSEQIQLILKDLSAAYPERDVEFFRIMYKHIVESKMSAARLQDAVNNAIRNVKYLHVADVLGYDKKQRAYTYPEMTAMITSGEYKSDQFTKFERKNNKPLWIIKS